eukprot:TRINITY_DN14645_c0_g1_i1.p1 TRINITY_DN14645_c0_g1~~TRINITY_DN14645_c0_g1_i1.p1  ORF type:complete len:304 (-),score=75.19 TRINITY_DN14645_c0_g1_i1:315-1226(-)
MVSQLLVLLTVAFAVSTPLKMTINRSLRRDGVPVALLPPGALEAELALGSGYPFKPFPSAYIAKVLASSIDWAAKGAVTPAKDQGALGYCGTFGRTAAAEGQYAIRSGYSLRNFSEEELVDCIGWDKDQFGYFSAQGFMDSALYPYNGTGHNQDPPIPGRPCRYDRSSVIEGTGGFNFTNTTGNAPSEDQLAAFLYRNGPVNTGINANVFGLRAKGCEATSDCFITAAMCNDPTIKSQPIDHSITLTGFGTDPVNGPYWIVKNSWSNKFGNNGFIKVARGISCAHIDCCGWVPSYGDPAQLYM